MFTTPAPSAPTISTTTSPASPTTASRGGRLRGLSYLRNYTQNHLHSRSESEGPNRSRPLYLRGSSQEANGENEGEESNGGRGSNPQSGTTSGWLPTVGGRAGVTRLSARHQHASPENAPASAELAPGISTTASSVPALRAMARTRSEPTPPVTGVRHNSTPSATNGVSEATKDATNQSVASIRFIPHFDPRATRPSLSFPAITRTLPTESALIKVGRYSERDTIPETNPNVPSAAPVGFKSKVVSRRHCEFWCHNSQWFIKDVKSSSGTFLNHLRLSPPGVESKPWPVNDGDVVQLGIDFRGGEEIFFRCVKIRIECNRGWQKGVNNFNKSTHKRLQNLAKPKDSDATSVNSSECSICLMPISHCQSLFVAPCSHVWHYKCIRPILNGHTWPNFLCPNCRAVADLEADVEEEEEDTEEWEQEEAVIEASKKELKVVNTTDGVAAPNLVVPESTNSDIADASSTRAVHRVPSREIEEPQRRMHGGNLQQHLTDEDDDLHVLVGLNNMALDHQEVSDEGSADDAITPPLNRQTDEDGAISANALSTPRAIPTRNTSGGASLASSSRNAPSDNPIAREVLSPGIGAVEGPMTPRNNAGPFVLDGGAGRSSSRSSVAGRARPRASMDGGPPSTTSPPQ